MYTNVKVLCGAVMMVAMVGTAGTRAEAAIIVNTGVDGGSGDVDNVLFGNCSVPVGGAGTTIQGCLNDDRSYLVDFTSDEEIFADASGQATIKATDGGFSYLQIAPVDGTFYKLQLNIDATENGSIFFTGSPGGESSMFALTGNGQNFFTITPDIGDDEFSWVSFNTTTDIVAEVRQVRLGAGDGSGTDPDPIPEPTSLVLFGLGMLGAGVAGRRTRS